MYKLLIFNEDYADEHDVPAIGIMSESEYDKWCNTSSGDLNPDYEKQLELHYKALAAASEAEAKIKDLGLWDTLYRDIPVDKQEIYTELTKKLYYYSSYPKKVKSRLQAYLGNGGECFEESYEHLHLMKEFVEEGLVKVYDISEELAKFLKSIDLERLSLCNVFEIDQI